MQSRHAGLHKQIHAPKHARGWFAFSGRLMLIITILCDIKQMMMVQTAQPISEGRSNRRDLEEPYMVLDESEPLACERNTAWSKSTCEVTVGRDIPPIKLLLYGGTGQESVRVRAFRNGQQAEIKSGYALRDSVAGSPPFVKFSGLQCNSNMVGTNFQLVFSSFYMDTLVEFTSPPLKIQPANDSLAITSWGVTPQLQDYGPWMIRMPLPPVTVTIMVVDGARKRPARSITSQDGYRLAIRLFNKGDLRDISETSLQGTRQQIVEGGSAVFTDLSVMNVGGKGYRLSFYLVGTDKVCEPSFLFAECQIWLQHQGPDGNLGGYYVEMMSQDLTFLPDLIKLNFVNARESKLLFGRVDDVLDSFAVTFFDRESQAQAIILEDEGFVVQAYLYNSVGMDISEIALRGIRIKPIRDGAAIFNDLVIKHVAGLDFTLRFIPSWRARCVSGLVDPSLSCSTSICCVNSEKFPVYPYSMSLQPEMPRFILEGGLLSIETFRISLLDSNRNPLNGISETAGFRVRAYLVQHEQLLPATTLVGNGTQTVLAGAANLTGLTVRDIAGVGFKLRVQELMSKIVESSESFTIYPVSLNVTTMRRNLDTVSANLLGAIVVRALGSRGQTLSHIVTADNFTLTATAWRNRPGGAEVILTGQLAYVLDKGVTTFDQLSIEKSAGRVFVNFTLARSTYPKIIGSLLFRIFPRSIHAEDHWDVIDFAAESPIAINISVRNLIGGLMDAISAVDNISIKARLYQHGKEVTESLWGHKIVVVDRGYAVFSDLAVVGRAGANFTFRFDLLSMELECNGSQIQNFSRPFRVIPSKFEVQPLLPDSSMDDLVPVISVSMLASSGSILNITNDFSITASLVSYSLLGCDVSSQCECASSLVVESWSDCAVLAAKSNITIFALRTDTCILVSMDTGVGGCVCTYPASTSLSKCNSSLLDGVGRPVGNESLLAFYELLDFSGSLHGQRTAVVGEHSAGIASFSDLKISGRFGSSSAMLVFSSIFANTVVRAATKAFNVDPIRIVLSGDIRNGPFNRSYFEGNRLEDAVLQLLDNSSSYIRPFVPPVDDTLMPSYVARLSLFHKGRNISWALNAATLAQRISNQTIRFKNIVITGASGAEFQIQIDIAISRNLTLSYRSMPFVVFPSRLRYSNAPSTEQTYISGMLFPVFEIDCVGLRSDRISEIKVEDAFTVSATLLKNGVTQSSLSGITRKQIIDGLATFDDLVSTGAGSNYSLLFKFESASTADPQALPRLQLPTFNIVPRYLKVVEGRTEFQYTYDTIVMERHGAPGLGNFSIQLQTVTGAIAENISASDGIRISARIFRNSEDVTSNYLRGTTSIIADYNNWTNIHAQFWDLRFSRPGPNLTLRFEMTGSRIDAAQDIGPLRSVPYSLRIQQRCYNGNIFNASNLYRQQSAVDVDDCTATYGTLTGEQRQFGYLTGYYFYRDNMVVGPLLRSIRNISRVPPIYVSAFSLNQTTLTEIVPSYSYYILASIFLDGVDVSTQLLGTRERIINGGVAQFDDLVLGSIESCPSLCQLTMRFSFVGALCSATLCSSMTISTFPLIPTPPHRIGTHPAFPGRTTIRGNVTLRDVPVFAFDATARSIFIDAFVFVVNNATGPPLRLNPIDVDIESVKNVSVMEQNRTQVAFAVFPASYGTANVVQYSMYRMFRSGFSPFLGQVCSNRTLSGNALVMCRAVTSQSDWTTLDRVFTAYPQNLVCTKTAANITC